MAEKMGDTILGTEKRIYMEQEQLKKTGGGAGRRKMGDTILGTEKRITMLQEQIGGEGKNQ